MNGDQIKEIESSLKALAAQLSDYKCSRVSVSVEVRPEGASYTRSYVVSWSEYYGVTVKIP